MKNIHLEIIVNQIYLELPLVFVFGEFLYVWTNDHFS